VNRSRRERARRIRPCSTLITTFPHAYSVRHWLSVVQSTKSPSARGYRFALCSVLLIGAVWSWEFAAGVRSRLPAGQGLCARHQRGECRNRHYADAPWVPHRDRRRTGTVVFPAGPTTRKGSLGSWTGRRVSAWWSAGSAGSLPAITAILSALPASFPLPILILQHHRRSPGWLAQILDRTTPLAVHFATDGEVLKAGEVLVAPPDRHLLVNPDATVTLSQAERVRFARPSADLLFESAARSYGPRVIAVVLSGTGRDGADGARAVKEHGGILIVQDETTSQFFGMPGAAIDATDPDFILQFVLPLDDIGPTLQSLTEGPTSP